MKRAILLISILTFSLTQAFTQADKVVGYWLTEDSDSQVRIFKATNGKYYGKIEWLDEPMENGKPKIDDDNPDPKLQNRPIMGLQLLNDFVYNSKEEEWDRGTIYDPKSGNTYDCYMWFEDDHNVLYIKGYVMGIRFLGRSTIWKRESKLRVD
jgi:uncharacterized protein (DUF2147 family)